MDLKYIYLTEELSRLNMCSKYLTQEIGILPLRGIRSNSARHASFDVLQCTPKISLMNLRCYTLRHTYIFFPHIILILLGYSLSEI